MHRLFCDAALEQGGKVVISTEDLHHLRDVLRLRDGETVALVDPAGIQGTGTVVREPEFALICTEKEDRQRKEEGGDVILYMGLAKGEKFDLIVQKTVELGVLKIVPVMFGRCIVRLSEKDIPKRLSRWNRIAREAAMQSGRIRIPEVTAPVTVAELCGAIEGTRTLLAWEMEKETSVKEALSRTDPEEPLALIVGPEGGIDEEEADRITGAGAVSVSLGSRILRCETAPIALMSIVEYERGGMEARK